METHQDGRPITFIRAPSDSSTAPLVPPPSISLNTSTVTLSRIQLDQPRRSPRFQPRDSSPSFKASTEDIYLDINVRDIGTWLGCKGYKGVLNTGVPVFAKLWDRWKHSSEELSLRVLWGTLVPRLIARGGWGFCPIIVLELIKVTLATCLFQYVIIFRMLSARVQLCRKQLSMFRSRETSLRHSRNYISIMYIMEISEPPMLLSNLTRAWSLSTLNGVF